jgi:hypothetical protein
MTSARYSVFKGDLAPDTMARLRQRRRDFLACLCARDNVDGLDGNYFQTEFRSDRDEIAAIDLLLKEVWRTLDHCHSPAGWPYTVEEGSKVKPEKSAST